MSRQHPQPDAMVRKNPLPPYFCWRDGRPRWVPGPKLRKAGYGGRDLKDAAGRWLPLGEAIEAAKVLNASVGDGAPLETPAAEHTFAALFAAFKGTPDKPSAAWKDLQPRTRKDYAQEMAILEQQFGDIPVGALKRIDAEEFYSVLVETKGLARANAITRVARLTVNHAINSLEWREIGTNRFANLKMKATPGRLVMWKPEEVNAFVACADWLMVKWDDGTTRTYESQGDAQILGLCTGQNRADVITAPEFVPENDVYRMARRKTGRMCYIPRCRQLDDRIATMRARRAAAWPNVSFKTELVSTALARSYLEDGHYFIHEHAKIRMIASGVIFSIEDGIRAMMGQPVKLRNLPFTPQPDMLDKTFQDLRDTAVTVLYALLKDIGRVATITGHSLKTAQEIIDKHYFVRNADMVKDAGIAFDDWLGVGRMGG